MKKLLHRLASLKAAVLVLVLLLGGLAAGTVIESLGGAEAARRAIYHSWWLVGLEVILAAGLVASLVLSYPWGRRRLGYLLTHASLLLILGGAASSYLFRVEGELFLWKGESGNSIIQYDPKGNVLRRTALPFVIELQDFRIDRYPGTMRPAGYRSDVRVIGPGASSSSASIWMNHELSHQGWRLFQSSYRIDGERVASVLSVSRDAGQPIVFLGYALLLLGMGTVLFTRVSQARAKGRRVHRSGIARQDSPATTLGAVVALGTAVAVGLIVRPAATDAAMESVRRLPVQHDGRVMPLDTLAREAVWRVTGERSWNGSDPIVSAVSWIFDPNGARDLPLLKLDSDDLRAAMGLAAGARHASLVELEQRREAVMEKARERPSLQSAAARLEERRAWLERFLDRKVLRCLPGPHPARGDWGVPDLNEVGDLVTLARGTPFPGWPDPSTLERELSYHRVQPTRVSWVVLFGAFLLSILAGRRRVRLLDGLALAALSAGLGVMTWGIVMRWLVAGRIPASNMYESLLFLAWGAGLFAVLAFPLVRERVIVANASALSALTLALADLLSLDWFVHPMPPVLAGTPWLAIHVPITMLGYAVLALGVVIAHVELSLSILLPKRTAALARLGDLLYLYLHAGSLLLAAGILSGSVWAASSWGRYWGWDPKEVWSLVALLAYLAVLHARREKMLGAFGVAVVSSIAFQAILITYLGVNFVLKAGLHSYGMGDSPVARWMAVIALLETGFLVWASLRWRTLRITGRPKERVLAERA